MRIHDKNASWPLAVWQRNGLFGYVISATDWLRGGPRRWWCSVLLEHPPACPGFKLSAAWLMETFGRGRRLLFHAAWILRMMERKVRVVSIAVQQGFWWDE